MRIPKIFKWDMLTYKDVSDVIIFEIAGFLVEKGVDRNIVADGLELAAINIRTATSKKGATTMRSEVLGASLEGYNYLGYANEWSMLGGEKPSIVTKCDHEKEFRGIHRICHTCKFYFDVDDSD